MTFFIYENFVHKKISIHKSTCQYCNDGNGKNRSNITAGENDKWIGPFNSVDEAYRKAQNIEGKSLSFCRECLGPRSE